MMCNNCGEKNGIREWSGEAYCEDCWHDLEINVEGGMDLPNWDELEPVTCDIMGWLRDHGLR